jgi:hypothetical protein
MEKEDAIITGDNNIPVTVQKQYVVAKWFRRIPKKIVLLFVSIILSVLFFILPANKIWFKDKLVGYWNDFLIQRKQLSLEKRKSQRFGTEYTYSKEISHFFDKRADKHTALVLVPSQAYFKKYGISYEVPEPVTFYYFTSLKTISPKNKNAGTANWYVTVRDKKIQVDSVTTGKALEDSIAAFKKF